MSVISPDQRAGYKLVPLLNSEESELSEDELESFYRDGFQIITRKNVKSADYHKLSKLLIVLLSQKSLTRIVIYVNFIKSLA